MTVQGTWVLTVSGPLGRQHVVVKIATTASGGLAGAATVDTEAVTLTEVTFDGDQLTWMQPPTGPLPRELAVGLRVRGNLATGHGLATDAPPVSVTGMKTAD